MKFEIKHKWSGSVLFQCEALTLKAAVELAVEKGAYLKGAYLKGAYLKGAYLKGAYLKGAYLEGAYLEGAYLKGAYLKGAYLEGAYLEGADLEGADLEGAYLKGAYLKGAYLKGADLEGAYLKGAYLKGADLEGADLEEIKKDFIDVILRVKEEIAGLYKALLDGRINGSVYEGECACLKGTIANLKKCRIIDLNKFGIFEMSSSSAERWFLAIQKGDTPANNKISAITQSWMEEYMKSESILIPSRKVVWE